MNFRNEWLFLDRAIYKLPIKSKILMMQIDENKFYKKSLCYQKKYLVTLLYKCKGNKGSKYEQVEL